MHLAVTFTPFQMAFFDNLKLWMRICPKICMDFKVALVPWEAKIKKKQENYENNLNSTSYAEKILISKWKPLVQVGYFDKVTFDWFAKNLTDDQKKSEENSCVIYL